jgi:hypothetical protein
MNHTAYQVNDSLGVEVMQTVKDLISEALYHILVEPTMLIQSTGN